jgi:hypothetical protein
MNNPQFKEQVEWELEGIEKARKVIMYFDPTTKSPVSLLELGLLASKKDKTIVVCPTGFWRKGNVDIVCNRYLIAQANNLSEAIATLT